MFYVSSSIWAGNSSGLHLMLDTARPGVACREVVRGRGWPGRARGVERYGAALSRGDGGRVRCVGHGGGLPVRVSCQAVHGWLGRYEPEGSAGPADHSHRPRHQPRQLDASVEALVASCSAAATTSSSSTHDQDLPASRGYAGPCGYPQVISNTPISRSLPPQASRVVSGLKAAVATPALISILLLSCCCPVLASQICTVLS